MKKRWLMVVAASVLMLAGCNLPGAPFDDNFNNDNVTPVTGAEGYYTDSRLVFCTEIRGSYKSNRAFTLDEENENLRVWDDIYLYEYDYFQMIVNESPQIYYSVKDEDLEYVTIDSQHAQATVKEGQSGIYKITFDLSTKVFDLQLKSEITTPVYERMDGCDVYTLSSGFTQMTVNPNDSEELMIADYTVQEGEMVSFYNHGNVHLSNYKVILDETQQGKYASALWDGAKHVSFLVGGRYNLYINPVTYALRVELLNPDTADYALQVYKDSETIEELTAPDENVPYVFVYQVTLKRNASVPIFVNSGFTMFDLSVNESPYFDSRYEMFNTAGTYSLEINLKTFSITATYIPQ